MLDIDSRVDIYYPHQKSSLDNITRVHWFTFKTKSMSWEQGQQCTQNVDSYWGIHTDIPIINAFDRGKEIISAVIRIRKFMS